MYPFLPSLSVDGGGGESSRHGVRDDRLPGARGPPRIRLPVQQRVLLQRGG